MNRGGNFSRHNAVYSRVISGKTGETLQVFFTETTATTKIVPRGARRVGNRQNGALAEPRLSHYRACFVLAPAYALATLPAPVPLGPTSSVDSVASANSLPRFLSQQSLSSAAGTPNPGCRLCHHTIQCPPFSRQHAARTLSCNLSRTPTHTPPRRATDLLNPRRPGVPSPRPATTPFFWSIAHGRPPCPCLPAVAPAAIIANPSELHPPLPSQRRMQARPCHRPRTAALFPAARSAPSRPQATDLRARPPTPGLRPAPSHSLPCPLPASRRPRPASAPQHSRLGSAPPYCPPRSRPHSKHGPLAAHARPPFPPCLTPRPYAAPSTPICLST